MEQNLHPRKPGCFGDVNRFFKQIEQNKSARVIGANGRIDLEQGTSEKVSSEPCSSDESTPTVSSAFIGLEEIQK